MKPQNKLQEEIFTLSQALPQISDEQKKWAFGNCLKHEGRKTKKGIDCLDCGTNFQLLDDVKKCICPTCKTKLTLIETRTQNSKQDAKLAIVEVSGAFQVVRLFEIKSIHKVGAPAVQYTKEIVQHWILSDGSFQIVARNRGYFCADGFHGNLEIKDIKKYRSTYHIYPDKVYPKMKVFPILKRNGFNGSFFGLTPTEVFKGIINYSQAETLLKAKQNSLFTFRILEKEDLSEQYWKAIKCCIRNNYVVKDANTYIDYLELLEFFNKDLTNPKYACPINLEKAHNKYVSRKNEYLFKLKTEELKGIMEQAQEKYYNSKKKYFGICFASDDIEISVLKDVKDFLYESLTHNHCVFTNEYYRKANSLILSAKVNGVSTETIEISLKEMKIVQSRGKGNRPTSHHRKIESLMRANLKLIKEVQEVKEGVGVAA